jgi:hypothetical protein
MRKISPWHERPNWLLFRMKNKRSSKSATSSDRLPPPTHEQITALAHQIWLERGQPEGRDLDNWLEAERQLRGEVRQPQAADDIPADNNALRSDAKVDPDEAIKGPIEKAIGGIATPSQGRSPTAL